MGKIYDLTHEINLCKKGVKIKISGLCELSAPLQNKPVMRNLKNMYVFLRWNYDCKPMLFSTQSRVRNDMLFSGEIKNVYVDTT